MPWAHLGWLGCAYTGDDGAEEVVGGDAVAADAAVVDGGEHGEGGVVELRWGSRRVAVLGRLPMVAVGERGSEGLCFQGETEVLRALGV